VTALPAPLDPERLERLRHRLRDRDWDGVTTEELADAIGLSRMTLYRRGIDKEAVLTQLRGRLETEYQDAIFPALVSRAPAAARLELALDALCTVNERYLGLLDALGRAGEFVFHEEGEGPVMTRISFTDALQRILEDGVSDGTLRAEDTEAMATLLFNATGWTYRHMRIGHRWEPEATRRRLVGLLLEGVGV
jgi:AcrR family transcriptional regulator